MARAVAKKEATDIAPSFMQDDVGKGTETLSSAALRPPRIKLMQALSPELDENDDLRPGTFFHDSAEIDLGKEVNVIPCFLTEAYLLFGPKQGDGLLARADDGVHWSPPDTDFEVQHKDGRTAVWSTKKTVAASGLDKWGTFDRDNPKSPPAANHVINAVVLLPDHLELGPAVLSFTRSSNKIGKKFASNCRMARAPSFGRVFTFSSTKVSGPEGDYMEPRYKPNGFVQDEDTYNVAKETYEAAKAQGVQVDLDERSSTAGDDSDY